MELLNFLTRWNIQLKLPFKAIMVSDLSSLIVHAIGDDRLKKTTLLVSSAPKGEGASTWDQAITACNVRLFLLSYLFSLIYKFTLFSIFHFISIFYDCMFCIFLSA